MAYGANYTASANLKYTGRAIVLAEPYASTVKSPVHAFQYTKRAQTMAQPASDPVGRLAVLSVPFLLAALIALLGVVWNSVSGDLTELKGDIKKLTAAVAEEKTSSVKGLAEIAQHQAVTNQKLDDAISAIRRGQRP